MSGTSERPIALVDCDGPLADFAGPTIDYVRELLRQPDWSPPPRWDFCAELPPDIQEAVWRRWRSPGFALSLPVVADAQATIEELRRHHEVYIVTAAMSDSDTWAGERERWLRRHFSIKPDHVVSTSAKHLVWGSYLIDDRVSNLQAWERSWNSSEYVFLWKMWHNADQHSRRGASSWSEMLRLILDPERR